MHTAATKACAALALALAARSAAGHEQGAPFSGAIIDPLVLHHAHIDNEQRLNFFALRRVEGSGRNGAEAELELGWSNEKFNFGVEAFLPLRSIPVEEGRETGIGDLEVRPIKYAIVNRPDFVLSTATAVTLPTGERGRGLGSGNTTLAQHLFLDKAFGNLYAGLNAGWDKRVRGERGTGAEYGAVLAYSFIAGTPSGGVADPRPGQRIVTSLSLEWVHSRRSSGEDAGERLTSLVPGVHFWWPASGWQIRAGLSVAKSQAREADRVFLLQIGNHLNWDRWPARR